MTYFHSSQRANLKFFTFALFLIRNPTLIIPFLIIFSIKRFKNPLMRTHRKLINLIVYLLKIVKKGLIK